MENENWVLEWKDIARVWQIKTRRERNDKLRTIDDEIRSTRGSWNEVKRIAGDRNACGSSSWMLYASQGVKGFDGDDDDDGDVLRTNKMRSFYTNVLI